MKSVSRRDFILSASAAGFCVLNCEALAQRTEGADFPLALNDSAVAQGMVIFKSGQDDIDAYLAHPNDKGRYPMVMVVTGSSIRDEYIQNLTAMLAQKGFVGVAPNIFWLQKESMTLDEKRKVFAEQITDERIFSVLQAALDYLKRQDFVKTGKIGITGFCFGGRCALMFATKSKEVGAVVPFYGNLRTPAFANRKEDPLDVSNKIKAPVQGHYSLSDAEIPLEQLKKFEESLRVSRTKVEMFTYDAPHGFFAYNRPTYNANAAKLAWSRMVEFLRRRLN